MTDDDFQRGFDEGLHGAEPSSPASRQDAPPIDVAGIPERLKELETTCLEMSEGAGGDTQMRAWHERAELCYRMAALLSAYEARGKEIETLTQHVGAAYLQGIKQGHKEREGGRDALKAENERLMRELADERELLRGNRLPGHLTPPFDPGDY